MDEVSNRLEDGLKERNVNGSDELLKCKIG
jgi:hypothetical protein